MLRTGNQSCTTILPTSGFVNSSDFCLNQTEQTTSGKETGHMQASTKLRIQTKDNDANSSLRTEKEEVSSDSFEWWGTRVYLFLLVVPLVWLVSFEFRETEPLHTRYVVDHTTWWWGSYFLLGVPYPSTVLAPGTDEISHRPLVDTADGVEEAIYRAFAPFHIDFWVNESALTQETNTTIFTSTGCDIFTVPFYSPHDQACIDYISNQTNWKSFEPIQQGEDERTLKFIVQFHAHDQMKGVVKVPQVAFPTESYGEKISYYLDRHLGFYRVPPTALVCIPKAYFRNVADTYSTLPMVEKYRERSNVTNYREWVEKDLLDYIQFDCVDSSIQIYMADVVGVENSVFNPGEYAKDDNRYIMFNATNTFPNHHEARHHAAIRVGFHHLSTLLTMDFIMGNTDRSIYKNNNVAGGCTLPDPTSESNIHSCRSRSHKKKLHRPGYSTFIHLDQGMYFLSRVLNSPLHNATTTFCYFSRPLYHKLQELEQEGLNSIVEFVEANTPPVAFQFYRFESLLNANRRLRQVLLLVERCVRNFGHEAVFEMSFTRDVPDARTGIPTIVNSTVPPPPEHR